MFKFWNEWNCGYFSFAHDVFILYLKYQNNANRFYNLILVRIFSISFNLTLFRS